MTHLTRIILTGLLLYGVYFEAGFFTTLTLSLFFLRFELTAYRERKMLKDENEFFGELLDKNKAI
jgi:hypothetical protein